MMTIDLTRRHPFARGISNAFLGELQTGCFASLFQTLYTASLDCQLRDGCVDWYAANGSRVLHLKEQARKGGYAASIHRKYVDGLAIPAGIREGDNFKWPVTEAFLEAFIASLPAILTQIQTRLAPETTVEEALIRASLQPNAPVLFFDRQVQVPGIRLRADLLGLQDTVDGPRVLLTELKYKQNNSIQHMLSQIDAYAKVMAPDGSLREDIAHAYQRVLAQKATLGLLPATVTLGEGIPLVSGLLVLYDYNLRSKLLDRLRASTTSSPWQVHLCLLQAGTYQLPPSVTWETL